MHSSHLHSDANRATPEPSAVRSRRPARPRGEAAKSVALVALLPPRVTVVVVTVHLPEARLVVVEDLQAPHPLGALPEVEMGNQQPRGAAVLGGQRLALV